MDACSIQLTQPHWWNDAKMRKKMKGYLPLFSFSYVCWKKKKKGQKEYPNPICLQKLMLLFTWQAGDGIFIGLSSFASQAIPHNIQMTAWLHHYPTQAYSHHLPFPQKDDGKLTQPQPSKNLGLLGPKNEKNTKFKRKILQSTMTSKQTIAEASLSIKGLPIWIFAEKFGIAIGLVYHLNKKISALPSTTCVSFNQLTQCNLHKPNTN